MKSLLQYFDAPDDFEGQFGWVCGLSADPEIMNEAMNRFTQTTLVQRDKTINLALLLDPRAAQIPSNETPGLLHLLIKDGAAKQAFSDRYQIMHAKVAILGFSHVSEEDRWKIRLIVSTGNWTRFTLTQSIDLAWSIEIDSAEIRYKLNKDLKQRCSDVAAAWDFMLHLKSFYDNKFFEQSPDSHTDFIGHWISSFADRAVIKGTKPRFFDNRKASMLDQLSGMVKNIKKNQNEWKSNFLALASGFYEAPSSTKVTPVVLREIEENLREHGHLHQEIEAVHLYVNPDNCQSIADCYEEIEGEWDWRILKPFDPNQPNPNLPQRTLHAKFIFGCNYNRWKNRIINNWIYLGSANLSNTGFRYCYNSIDSRQSRANLETGVVFRPTNLVAQRPRKNTSELRLKEVLPVHLSYPVKNWLDWVVREEEMSGAEEYSSELQSHQIYLAAPVSHLIWQGKLRNESYSGDLSILSVPSGESHHEIFPEGSDGSPLESYDSDKDSASYIWSGARPQIVRVQWNDDRGESHDAYVPVTDKHHRPIGVERTSVNLNDAWSRLMNFPHAPDDDPDPDEDWDDNTDWRDKSDPRKTNESSSIAKYRGYPIREMMGLIENIADKQSNIAKVKWKRWCIELQSALESVEDREILERFKQMKINPISPLWHDEFRPDYASSTETEEGKRYEEVLQTIEQEWEVHEYQRLGE